MTGRTVAVGHVQRVWCAYPPVSYLVYAVDPSLLIGWTGPLPEASKRYIAPRYRNLPVVGGWFGQHTANLETIAAAKPDLALVWDQSLATTPGMEQKLTALGIPVASVRLMRLSDYPDALRFLGTILERQKRAQELSTYIQRTQSEMNSFSRSIPENEKLTVYYAIGPDGLKNDCAHMPFLDEAIELAGAHNAHHCREKDMSGANIDFEQLLAYDPNVIITQDDIFFSRVYTDSRFAHLRAVRQHRVYMIPKQPFNWLNYPPSFMRAVGIRWLAWKLYPTRYHGDLPSEVVHFFKLFLGVDITAQQARELIH